jgi:TP901 family phage tail tape measure protein
LSNLDFRVSWQDTGAKTGLRALAQQTKQTRTEFESLKTASEKAGQTLKQAQGEAADAARKVAAAEANLKETRQRAADSAASSARKVATAEAKLNQLRQSGKATEAQILAAEDKLASARASGKANLSQILTAEDRLASARRRQVDATGHVSAATKDLESVQGRLANTTKVSTRGLHALSDGAGKAASGIGSLAKMAGKAGLVGAGLAAGAAVVGLGGALAGSVDKASKFDQTMRSVGVTTGQSGEKMKGLTDLALKMGAQTSFSAQGASDAMLALAKGGMTAAQMKAGALHETLTLATAGGLDLGNAADYMVQGLNSFGLKAEQANRVTTALAGGANASTASVESMGLALSQTAAQAHTAGLSIEDTTAALAAFDNAGIKGSDAGTSLKRFLQQLVPTTDSAISGFQSLGLMSLDVNKTMQVLRDNGVKPTSTTLQGLTDQFEKYAAKQVHAKQGSAAAQKEFLKLGAATGALQNQFFKANGDIKSMADVSQTLQDALKGQTKEQKIATLTTLFGSDASRAAAILTDQGARGLAKYVKATKDKSQAEKLAANATHGYAGALERFKGSVETAQIQFGTKLLPTLSKGLDLMTNRLLPAVTKLGTTAGPMLSAFGRIATGTFRAFFKGADTGRSSFQRFIDFLSTHQADLTGGFITGAKVALGLGKAIATGASVGLRAFALLSDEQASMVGFMIDRFGEITHAGAIAFGWIPGIGDKLKTADAQFAPFAARAKDAMHRTGQGARDAADAIDQHVLPAIDKAQSSLDKLGNTEIAKAKLRDTASKAALAIRDVGTNADGSQIKLKHFSDASRLGAAEQSGLRNRLDDAKVALRKQIHAMQDAHASQGQLTTAWKTGRDRLYDEFRQMGLSKEEARKLARQYAGVPPIVRTKIEQPGMARARGQVEGLHQDIRKLPNRDALVKILTSSNYKAVKKQFDMTFPQSRAEGGPIVGYSPHPKADNIPVNATAGEFMQPVSSVKYYGTGFMERLRTRSVPRAALGLADGGLVTRTIRINTSAATSGAALPDVGYMAARMGRYMGEAMSANFQKQFDAWGKKHADGGLGDPAHVSNPRGLTSYHGGTFTRLFVANLKAAERAAGKTYSIYQGGFRPSTSYSGSTHNMDAVDARVDYTLLRAFRRFVGAMGDRTGLGNWMSHMHGVPAPGHGYGSPSARAQYQDYLRRGGGSQSPRSPWGLAYGGVMTKPSLIGVAERGPERVLSAYQTKQFDRLVSTISGSGGGTTIVINVDAPNYVGSNKDLAAAIFKLAQTGELKKSIRKAGVGV